ncbi:MAG: GNAT family N-acetyltransferase [Anaerolineales bacterium]
MRRGEEQAIVPAGILVRTATGADASLLAELGAETFRASFGAYSSPEDMAAYLAASFRPEVQAAELADGASLFLIAAVAGEAVGYARLRLGSPPEVVRGRSPMEIVRFYSRKDWIGRGVGRALMRACLEAAEHLGCDRIWLGVWERNQRAISFYRKWGFAQAGTKTFRLGNEVSTDWVMERSVEGGAK